MNPIWADDERVLQGRGPSRLADPGTGRNRYHWVLDELRRTGRELAFASFTFDIDASGSVVDIPEAVSDGPLPSATPMGPMRLADDGVDEWHVGFEKAMLEIETGRVEKVVLARQVSWEAELPIEPSRVVARLAAHNPGCYVFSVGGLVGASPELLVSLRHGVVKTLALAGTATDPDELRSDKISEEHRHVSASVTEALRPHMKGVDVTEQVIVPHGDMSHVGTRISGRAIPGTTVADILADLHPTAAVAGYPKSAALDLIREVEPASRDRYAGPVGWMDAEGDGVFAIALRCGQIDGSRITLYSGGGLVAGSEETAELYETELKLAPMLEALGQR